jgi:hypothetical protein
MLPAIVSPRTDATTTGAEIGKAATPTPIATIDSPRATIRISPWRSAKSPAEFNRHPDAPPSMVPT